MMILKSDEYHEFFNKILDLSLLTYKEAKQYLNNHQPYGYCFNYPQKEKRSSIDELLFPNNPFICLKIPKYNLADFPKDKTDYSAIFYSFFNSNLINCSKLIGFNDLLRFIKEHEELRKLFSEKSDPTELSFFVERNIHNIVGRFLFISGTELSEDKKIKDNLTPFVTDVVNRFSKKELNIDILVPISFLTFEEDHIKLSDDIEIVKIPEEIQKSRSYAVTYESNKEEWAAACTTHMLLIHDYHVINREKDSVNQCTKDYNSYPIEIIDQVFGIIQTVTGFETGYTQLIAKPLGWIDGFYADLEPLYGTSVQKAPIHIMPDAVSMINVNIVSTSACVEIQSLFDLVDKNKHNKKYKKVLLSLSRLNRCMLKSEIEDTAIDAIIGIETLLSGGTHGEITYTISNRISLVFSLERNISYSPNESRCLMKKIYNYRSLLVHGQDIKGKDEYVKFGENEKHVKDIAVDFLRNTLLFMIKNQQYLDESLIDKEIDMALEKYKA